MGVELEAISKRERVSAGDERELAAEILSAAKDLAESRRKRVGVELEPFCGRERSGSPQAKS